MRKRITLLYRYIVILLCLIFCLISFGDVEAKNYLRFNYIMDGWKHNTSQDVRKLYNNETNEEIVGVQVALSENDHKLLKETSQDFVATRKNYFKQNGWEFIDADAIMFGNKQGFALFGKYNRDGKDYRVVNAYVAFGKKDYQIYYKGLAQCYDKMNVLDMIESFEATRWLIQTVDDKNDVGVDTSIVVDKQKRPHIAYFDSTNGALKYAYKIKGEWKIKTIDKKGWAGEEASIEVTSKNKPRISYTLGEPTKGVKYARKIRGKWRKEFVERGKGIGLQCSLALDSNDRPHLSYTYEPGRGVRYAHWNGSTWLFETVDSSDFESLDTAIAMDSNDRPHIVYTRERNGRLKHTYKDITGLWQIEFIDANTKTGEDLEMRISRDDVIHVAYLNYKKKYRLKHAWGSFGNWQIKNVTKRKAGRDIGLSLSKKGRPYIVFSDRKVNSLNVANKKKGKWNFQKITSMDVGDQEIAVDKSGGAHVSFKKEKKGVLMYAFRK